ncbi:EAL domain, c-di-GMP-specific phosphodiesterase class I (or its enzymatically inactive variant) [Modicisalibacter muralis]|uniref:EAL domain, c-di-GMP-specific phosphodiesterase class I (Or its enzymatically inactive variant) n=1 Tax=Modicisalibacter muralis TaxID=119000 RepID=A0A1G9FB81_9GAMM|nr:EAL domain-containing protein [Halomonas muralis]SDK85664.1 EAL domain, c-di-GMP-specific phosphodiesterase class I (or its enzymatically inactive variant) [Halomonas muralis]
MSLITRLWLAISLILALAFGGSLFIGIVASKQYIEQELHIKNADNANALALSLSQLDKEPIIVELLIAAQFDTGHYQRIELIAPDGSVIERRVSDTNIGDVPDWFIDLVAFSVPAGTAVVQDGWRQYATVKLQSHYGYAYRSLWQGVIDLMLWFGLAALTSAGLAWWVVRSIRKPLRAVVSQAQDIGQRRFTTSHEPRTRELRQVVVAMNRLSNAVRTMLAEETRKLDRLRCKLQQDEVTGIARRDYLLSRLDAMLGSDGQRAAGHVVMVRLANLNTLNSRLGYAATNRVLADIAAQLESLATGYDEGQAGRLNGSDFALLLPGSIDARSLIEELKTRLHPLTQAFDSNVELPLSLVAYARGDSRAALLSVLDGALAKAETGSGRAIEVATTDAKRLPYKTHDEWRHALKRALENDEITLSHYPVVDSENQLLHYECPARLKLEGEWQTAGLFLPWVNRTDLGSDFDLMVVEIALREIAEKHITLGINLSGETIRDTGFIAALHQRLRDYPAQAAQLWVELPESAAVRHMDAFRTLCHELRPYGCKVGLEHVGPEFGKLQDLHDLGLAYIKVDVSLVRNIHLQPQAQPFLRGIATVSHAIGMLVIGEGVTGDEERETLFDLGLDGVTGPGVRIRD